MLHIVRIEYADNVFLTSFFLDNGLRETQSSPEGSSEGTKA